MQNIIMKTVVAGVKCHRATSILHLLNSSLIDGKNTY